MGKEQPQEEFLRLHTGKWVAVSFVDGKKIVGRLQGFDPFAIFLLAKGENGNRRLMVYKHAIRYISVE